ncbi:alpha/beta hydrolase family protein [Stigmatella erecta]|uniref:Predicted dienelactone hydrolase n=1 Tax=Stigmatella erecta TaxID=83460 RepID=A0A1I0DHH7_9BACT|nr:chlorophyllase [Stigmatella erecta]SET31865.1 Predicted dienelactone hydrolase [Stigmatella erecta]
MLKPIPRTENGAFDAPAPVVSVSPAVLPAPGRGADLEVRVSAPVTGSDLPIIVFAHGHGSSSDGYLPLAHYWAARGFVVVQPTFLDSRTFGLEPDDPRTPSIWKLRIDDVTRVLDHLDVIEASVPGLTGRVDRSRLAAAGHSFGAQTVGMLLGARMRGPDGRLSEDLSDPRIKAGVLLCAGGRGGDALSPLAREHFPYLNQVYAGMTTPALVVAGDRDNSPLTVRGPEWFTDAYTLSPGPKSLLTLSGAEHMLGGISGDRVTETTDENPARVAAVQRLTWAYLHTALSPGDRAWPVACAELMTSPTPQGRVESK